jgi:hypothetical protein
MKTTKSDTGIVDTQTDAEPLADQHKPAADSTSGEVIGEVADVLTGVAGVAIDILGSIFD